MSEDEIRKEFEKLYVACANSSNIYRDQYGEYESIEAGMAWWGYLAAWNAALEAAAKVCDEQAEGQTNVYVFACLNNAVAIRALKEQSNEVG